MVRPTGLRGRGRFSMVRPTRLEGFRFSMVRPTRLEGFRFSMVRPTGPGGFVFQWFAQRAWRGFVFQWFAQRAWRGFVFQWFAQRLRFRHVAARQPAELLHCPGSLLYVLYVLYLTRQPAEPPLSPSSLLYVLYVLYGSYTPTSRAVYYTHSISTCTKYALYSTYSTDFARTEYIAHIVHIARSWGRVGVHRVAL